MLKPPMQIPKNTDKLEHFISQYLIQRIRRL